MIQQFTAVIRNKESGILTSNRYLLDQQFPALVLAAGRGSRMGRYKQMLRLPGRGTLLDNAIGQARMLSRQVRVVAGAGYPLVRYHSRQQPSSWIYCPEWQLGLAESLKAGIRSLGPSARGVFVVLGDQPLLAAPGLTELARLARHEPGIAFAADYGKRVGVPAWIPRLLWPQVLELEGDAGAGAVLNRANARRVSIPGVEQDIDTPADWQELRRLLAEQA